MSAIIRNSLFAVTGCLYLAMAVWQAIGHFDIDFLPFLRVVLVAGALFGLGIFYTRVRNDARLAAMLFAVSFMLLFAPACNVLTYFASTIAGPRIDTFLAGIDRALGIGYPALVSLVIPHPWLIAILGAAYHVSAYQVLAPMVLLGFRGDPGDIARVCVAVAVCAFATILFWTVFPSFGAYTVYDLHALGPRFHVVFDTSYPRFLNDLFVHGPGRIRPDESRGLIGFPSFHTQEILLCVWYLRKTPFFLIPAVLFSAVALMAVPIQGGHHIIDVIGAFPFAALGIWAADALVGLAERRRPDPVSGQSARA